MAFPVFMYGCELHCEESWAPKNWCFWTVVLEKTLESPLDCKEIQPVHPKADQSWVLIGRTNAEAETPILWPPHVKSWLIGKDPDAGRDWGQEDRGWDGWMASPTWWTWVWVNSGSWWWTGRPGMLWFMGLQRVGHDWETELNWRIRKVKNLLRGNRTEHTEPTRTDTKRRLSPGRIGWTTPLKLLPRLIIPFLTSQPKQTSQNADHTLSLPLKLFMAYCPDDKCKPPQ